jgi:hypothetical protein
MQAMTLQGNQVCSVSDVATRIGRATSCVVDEIDGWVSSGHMDWVDGHRTYKLIPPAPTGPGGEKKGGLARDRA